MSTSPKPEATDWPEFASGLYDKLTGRGAEIAYQFEDFLVQVPSGAGNAADHAVWKLNGTLRIRSRAHEAL